MNLLGLKPVKGQSASNIHVSKYPDTNSEVKVTCLILGEHMSLFVSRWDPKWLCRKLPHVQCNALFRNFHSSDLLSWWQSHRPDCLLIKCSAMMFLHWIMLEHLINTLHSAIAFSYVRQEFSFLNISSVFLFILLDHFWQRMNKSWMLYNTSLRRFAWRQQVKCIRGLFRLCCFIAPVRNWNTQLVTLQLYLHSWK